MYNLGLPTPCVQFGQECDVYDDDYDEYLMWHSTSSYIMLKVNMVEGCGVPLIPALEQGALLQMPSFISPLCVSYTATPNFKFPPVQDGWSMTQSSASSDTDSSLSPTRVSQAMTVIRRGLQNTKRRFSNIF